MAIAAAYLTDFGLVSQAEEDQRYFSRFTESSKLGEIRDRISSAADFLYEAQAIEHQEETSRRERTLNLFLVVLALLTVFSVVADVRTFLGSQPGLHEVLVVTTTGAVLAVLGSSFLWF